jgi:uncharacterized surface protein with fasciclin (FAS1) repeats
MLTRRVLSLALLATALMGCASAPAPATVAEIISKNSSLSTFNGLITQAGLSSTLNSTGPFTVFAPSNDAFKLLPAKVMTDLEQHPEKLKNVLMFHVITGKLTGAEVKNSAVKTLNGSTLALSKAGNFVTIEEAVVEKMDMQASNGVIHMIDGVLTPPVKK